MNDIDTSMYSGGNSHEEKIAILTETNNRLKKKLIEMVKALDAA